MFQFGHSATQAPKNDIVLNGDADALIVGPACSRMMERFSWAGAVKRNVERLQELAQLVRLPGHRVATLAEARAILGIRKV